MVLYCVHHSLTLPPPKGLQLPTQLVSIKVLAAALYLPLLAVPSVALLSRQPGMELQVSLQLAIGAIASCALALALLAWRAGRIRHNAKPSCTALGPGLGAACTPPAKLRPSCQAHTAASTACVMAPKAVARQESAKSPEEWLLSSGVTTATTIDSPAGSLQSHSLRAAAAMPPAAKPAAVPPAPGGGAARTPHPAGACWRLAQVLVRAAPSVPYESSAASSFTTVACKIQGVEPEDLADGYEERLKKAAASVGCAMLHCYVRRGCIELVIDLLEAPAALHSGTASVAGCPPLDAATLLETLGLPPGAVVEHLQCVPAAPADGRQHMTRLVLEAQPRITRISPRVVLSARQAACTRADAGGREASSLAAGRQQHPGGVVAEVVISADVLCPEGIASSEEHPLELLVRHRGTYVPFTARAVSCQTGDADSTDSDCTHPACSAPQLLTFELCLPGPALPPHAGLLLAECRKAPGVGTSVPVLLVDDAAMASELQQAVVSWGARSADELDDLLFDLGLFLEQSHLSVQIAAQANDSEALRWHHSLGAGLLAYACRRGWRATAQRLARGLRGLGVRLADVAPGRLLPRGSSGLLTRAAASGSARMAAQAAVWACGLGGVQEHVSGVAGAAAAAAARRLPMPVLQALGVCRTSPEEEEAFQLFSARCIAVPARIIHGVEAVLLMIVCARTSGDGLAMVGNAGALLAVLPSLVAACVCLLVGRAASQKLLRMAGMARQLCYLAAMLVVLVGERLAAPPHSVLQQYSTGPAVVVMEGLVVPASCLVPLPAALFVALVRVPLWAHCYLYLCSGNNMGSPNLWTAYARSLLISSLAVATTLTCQVCLRAAFRRCRGGAGSVQPSERGSVKED